MDRLAVSILLTFVVVFGLIYGAVQLFRYYVSEENAQLYNQTCFNYGVNLTQEMQANETISARSCECRYGSYTSRLNCLCDCVVDVPLQTCNGLEGCRVLNQDCVCTYSVSFE